MQGTSNQSIIDAARKSQPTYSRTADTLAGIEATDVVQRNNVLVFSGEFTLMTGTTDAEEYSGI